jgi:hypothetical protein
MQPGANSGGFRVAWDPMSLREGELPRKGLSAAAFRPDPDCEAPHAHPPPGRAAGWRMSGAVRRKHRKQTPEHRARAGKRNAGARPAARHTKHSFRVLTKVVSEANGSASFC